jgi:F0F1-type ATP synthase membrane subunit c/vacuolar-type H+-ATPase subunit K
MGAISATPKVKPMDTNSLREFLEPIAAQFRNLGTPEPIVHWGHPVMMGIVVLAMGSAVAYSGWQSRLTQDGEVAAKNRAQHRQIAPLMFLFVALGYTGGILSLVMQEQPILESPHFWTGSAVIALLSLNSLISLVGFGGEQKQLFRSLHAYLGAGIMILFLVHGIFGLQLGLSI